ncbi:hypothetical protein F5Y16DRAFT_307634 [Xylariaceae sp. FL0255]|nr:hypothetical protein F5Y16DRAFT_307634 [Xylariaceae sp. FL0255]
MRFSKTLALGAVATGVNAQRPSNTSICDYYTTALLKNNTADNQATLLTLVVNTVVIGNYTQPNVGVIVPGILAPGKYNGVDVNLLPYFNGDLASSNRGGSNGVSINFLDDGGATPLTMNKPSNGTTSNQYFLLTHLYQFFGSLLGCSEQGMPGFDAYMGHPSMYEVHKFMDLDEAELGYFITQVGLAASSFGVADSDVQAVGTALNSTFGYRCSAPATVIKAQGPQLQAICIADDCPLATSAVCASYSSATEPASATPTPSSYSSGAPTSSYPVSTPASTTPAASSTPASGSPTSSPSSVPTGGAATNGLGLAAVAGGIAAFLL